MKKRAATEAGPVAGRHLTVPFCAVSALAFLLPSAAHPQILAGILTEAGTGRPVVGALVRLESESPRRMVSALSGADGSYRLRAPQGGEYSVAIERIGYATRRVEGVDIGPTSTTELNLTVETSALHMVGLEVTAASRACELVANAAVEIQTLWDEARKALDAALLTEQAGDLRFRISSRTALLDPRSHAVREEDRRVRNEWGANTVRSLPPTELAAEGYVREAPDGSLDLFAPDAAALLSPEFLQTHCLLPEQGTDSVPDWVGLRFRPVPGRPTRDIEGVLWLHGASLRLERLDFKYTGLPDWPGTEHARGSIRFAELPDGRWIVRDWYIRAPVVGVVKTSGVDGTVRRMMVTAIAERSSAVLSARGGSLDWAADRGTGTVTGLVFDSLLSTPLHGAQVRLAGRSWRAESAKDGRFRIEEVPPGLYRVEFTHPRYDSAGIDLPWSEAEVRPGEVTDLRLAGPSKETLLVLNCGLGGRHVVGFVTSAQTGDPVPGASVIAIDTQRREGSLVRGQTDSDGGYALCRLPDTVSVTVVARLGPRMSTLTPTNAPAEGHARLDLTIDLSSGYVSGPSGRQNMTFARPVTGTAVDLDSGAPLVDVLIELLDAEGNVLGQALSDSQGRFTLPVAYESAKVLRARRLGYGDVQSDLRPESLLGRALNVRMAPEALDLDGIIVTVEARSASLERNGFYQRQALSGGQFLVREDIEALVPVRTTDVLLRMQGVQIVTFAGESGNTTVRRIQLRGARRFTNDQRCLPGVYVDGMLVRHPMIPLPEQRGGDPFRRLSNYPQVDDLVAPHDIEAIEVYDTPSVTPPQFRPPGPSCGVIVVWTRRGPGT